MKFRHTRIFLCSLPVLLFFLYYLSHQLHTDPLLQESPRYYQQHPFPHHPYSPHPKHPRHYQHRPDPSDQAPRNLPLLLLAHPRPHPPSLTPTLSRPVTNISSLLLLPFPHHHRHKKPPPPSPPPPPSSSTSQQQQQQQQQQQRCFPIPSKFPISAPFFPCPWFSSPSPPNCSQRLRARLQCLQSGPVRMVYEWVSVDTPPAAYAFDDDCLERAVKDLCYADGKDLIPNLSHQVLFGGHPLRNYSFLAFISAARFLQPCMLMVHADRLPTGHFWDTLVRLLPHIIHVQREPPKVIFGHKIEGIEHSSDVARLEAVRKFGGVYQDTDYLLLNPIDDLRQYSVVMGKSIPNQSYCNCIFMGKAGAEFLNTWYDTYRTFDDSKWDLHSTKMPFRIHKRQPRIPFHEVNTLVTPYFGSIKRLFYRRLYNWKRLHGVHLYTRLFKEYFLGPYERRNSSLGQVSRRVLFGDSEACFKEKRLLQNVIRMKAEGSAP